MNYIIAPGLPKEAFLLDPEEVIERCAALFNSTVKQVKSTHRGRGKSGWMNAVDPRQLAIAIIKARTIKEDKKGKGMPYTKIGMLFKGESGKGKDHSTCIHAINQVANALDVDEDYRDMVDDILEHYGLKYLDIFRLSR